MKILFSGDSFTYGDELKNYKKDRFSTIVSDYFGAECINVGRRSAGNDEILLNAVEYLETNNVDVCVIQLSDVTRMSLPGKEFGSFKTLKPNSQNTDLDTKIAKYIYSTTSANNAMWYRLTRFKLLLLDEYLTSKKINTVYALRRDEGYFDADINLSKKLKSKFLSRTFGDIITNNKEKGGHPSAYGHKLIADEIIKKIENG